MAAKAGSGDILTVLRALADPKRLRLFLSLRSSERCVSDLVTSEQLPQPLVSHHLAVLVRAGLVQARRSEGFTMYAVDADGLAAAQAAVVDLLDPDVLTPRAFPGGNPGCCREGAC